MTELALVLAIVGSGWGFVADRIAARWPEHEADEPSLDTGSRDDRGGPGAAGTRDARGRPWAVGALDASPAADAVARPAADAEPSALRPAGWIRAIDWRTPVVVAIGATALGTVGLRFDAPAELLVFAGWAAVLSLMFATDLDQRLLPDVLTLPLIPIAVVLVLAGLDPFVAPDDLPVTAVVSMAVPAGLYAISIPFGAGAFGLGDVKFLIGFGLLAGAERFVVGLASGILLAGVIVVGLLALRRIKLHTFIPYGPFLIMGALWALLGAR